MGVPMGHAFMALMEDQKGGWGARKPLPCRGFGGVGDVKVCSRKWQELALRGPSVGT